MRHWTQQLQLCQAPHQNVYTACLVYATQLNRRCTLKLVECMDILVLHDLLPNGKVSKHQCHVCHVFPSDLDALFQLDHWMLLTQRLKCKTGTAEGA